MVHLNVESGVMMLRACVLTLVIFAASLSASAQSRAELALKVERLEREMIALENRLRGAGGPAVTSGAAPSSSDRALLADLAAKIGTVERQMRSLTGRLEEIEFRLRQQDQAMERLRQEMDLQQQAMIQSQLDAAQQSSQASSVPPAGGQPPVSQPASAGTPPSTATPEPTAPAIALPEGDENAQYQYAFDFIKGNDLENGFTAMDLFLKANPAGSLAGNAKFWLGRIHLRQGRMPQAAQQLLALIEEHPNHDKRTDALVDLADVLIALDSASDACNALAEFRRSEDKASPRLKARAARTATSAGCAF